MEKIILANEQATGASNDDTRAEDVGGDIRALKDLEMVLVGGGSDDTPCWP